MSPRGEHVIQSGAASSCLSRQPANENRGDRRLRILDISRSPSGKMYFINWDTSNFGPKRLNYARNSGVFPVCCGLLVLSICVAWFGPNSMPIGESYLFFTVTDQIQCTDFKFRCCAFIPQCVVKPAL